MAKKNATTAFCGVYAIVNLETGRTYIGSAVNVRQRWVVHRYGLRSGRANPGLLTDWRAQGGLGFLFVTLRSCAEVDLARVEQEVIDATASDLYNIYPARRYAGRTGCGIAKSTAHRRAIAVALSGKPKSKRAIELMRAALTGRKLPPRSAETRAKLSEANMGRTSWAKGKANTEAHLARRMATKQRTVYRQKGWQWPDVEVEL